MLDFFRRLYLLFFLDYFTSVHLNFATLIKEVRWRDDRLLRRLYRTSVLVLLSQCLYKSKVFCKLNNKFNSLCTQLILYLLVILLGIYRVTVNKLTSQFGLNPCCFCLFNCTSKELAIYQKWALKNCPKQLGLIISA